MARLNITLDQGEMLQLLGDSGGDAFRALLQESVNAVLRAESDEQLRAGRYEWLPRAMSQETRFLRSRAPTCRNIYGFCVPLRRKRACPVARYTVFAFPLARLSQDIRFLRSSSRKTGMRCRKIYGFCVPSRDRRARG